MNEIQTTKTIGPIASALIGIVGTIASIVITMQLKKLLESRGLSDRASDVKAALARAHASTFEIRASAAQMIADSVTAAAQTATAIADAARAKANG